MSNTTTTTAQSQTQQQVQAKAKSTSRSLVAYEAFYGFTELAGWLYCSFQQIITTHDSIVGILQGGTLAPSHVTAQEIINFFQSNMDKYNKIGWTVAIITQIVYWGTVLPGSPVHGKLIHRLIVLLFFVLEVVTDLWYSIATNTTLGGAFVWVFNFGNGGWIASLAYIAAMTAGSMFLGPRAFYRLGKVFGPVFRAQRANA